MHTLPRDITAFIGRSTELDALVNSVVQASVARSVIAIHAIDGMAGIGKTALAIHAGHLLATRFPDGQHFLRLHGNTPGKTPVEPADALTSLLTVQGLSPQEIPADLDAKAAMWRDRVAGKRVLLILDDASGHHQVEPLLPGTKECLVMITSRRRLTALDDAVTVPLDVLRPEAAVELFAHLSGRANAAAEHGDTLEIVRLCGYLPLAIGLLAAKLRHHSSWTVADLAADLRSVQERLPQMHAEDVAVAGAFETSYQELDAGQKQLFQRLSLHPGVEFDAYGAAALGDLSLSGARRGLDALYVDHLLDEPVRGRFQMHDLVREYAGSLARGTDPSDLDDAVKRLLDYYQYVAAVAGAHVARAAERPDAAIAPPRTAVPEIAHQETAIDWFGAERTSLLACIDFAAQEQEHVRVVRLASAIAPLLRHVGPWDGAVRAHELAVTAAVSSGDRPGQAGALLNLGVISFLRGDYSRAREALSGSLSLYQTLGDRAGQARSLTDLGTFQRLTGDYRDAIEAQTRALEIYREFDDRPGQVYALTELGAVRPMIGDYPGAGDALASALEIARTLDDRLAEAYALNELGTMRHFVGDYSGAAESLAAARDISRDLGDRFAEAYALNELGLVKQLTGDYDAARAASTEALRIYRDIGSRLGEADALRYLGTLGSVNEDEADRGPSREALAQALEICRELGDRFGQANVLANFGNLLRLEADYPGAEEALTQALEIYGELEHRRGESEAANHYGALLLDRNEIDDAAARYRIALDRARDVHSPLEEARALEGLSQCSRLRGETESARDFLNRAGAIYHRIGFVRQRAFAALLAGSDAEPGQSTTAQD
ncbi:tetratricopeptide repeat protein [Amycolatopsis sp. A133]|uniref:ATP-binding protein n=1 Tax=Amycolatopsis sp. A133 TaxID=3064472 RepID=UPI0027EC91E7|nr:tetratricopeptide repeat protein [Amycolatopsis sp. A133]MDQ7809628.1 tetratricopeptide repeat protein [Amycolatopsis sp. A133]